MVNLKKWEVLKSTYILKTEWFNIRKDTVKLPNGMIYPDYYVKERPDWVAIYGLTDSKEVILLRTYKHGSKSLIYELPSGSIDEKETPENAVKRELLEETGFILEEENLMKVGRLLVDPTYTQAHLHIFVGRMLRRICGPEDNPRETSQILLLPRDAILEFIRENMEAFPESQVACIYLATDFLNRNNW